MGEQNTALVARNGPPATIVEQVVLAGDLSKLSPEQRVRYYRETCDSLGLNPLTQPFQYINLNGKLTLYCTRAATDQLRALRKVSLTIVAREKVEDLYVVTARAITPDGRTDESIGAVSIGGLKGDALANAFMKAETKAKRRVTLAVVGLGWLDESETGTIAGAQTVTVDDAHAEPTDPHRFATYAEQPFAERTGADPVLEGPAPEKPKAEPPKPMPDMEAVDAQFDELVPPREQGQPKARRFGQAHSLWKACLNKGLCGEGHEPSPEWDDELVNTFITNWEPELKKSLGRK